MDFFSAAYVTTRHQPQQLHSARWEDDMRRDDHGGYQDTVPARAWSNWGKLLGQLTSAYALRFSRQ